jgi:intein/homing endonuclease
LTFDLKKEKLVIATNPKLITARHSNLIKLRFIDREITVTDDHPFWTQDKIWASLNPDKSNQNYLQEEPVKLLSKGDKIFVPEDKSFLEIIDIVQVQKEQLTYTLEFENGESFIANGLLVKTEKVELIK